jgi:transposase-like protein
MREKLYIYKVVTGMSRQEGRPQKYKSEYHPDAAHEVMKLGATKKKLAQIFDISEETLYDWIRNYEQFSESIQGGIDFYKSASVEHALHKRAVGFNYTEKHYEKPTLPPLIIAKGQQKDKILAVLKATIDDMEPILVKEVTKHYPPDTAAIKFYLGNRDGERWPKNLVDEKKILSRVPPPKKKEINDGKKGTGRNRNKRISKGKGINTKARTVQGRKS